MRRVMLIFVGSLILCLYLVHGKDGASTAAGAISSQMVRPAHIILPAYAPSRLFVLAIKPSDSVSK